MITVNGLVWDDWNKKHVAEHGISIKEVEQVCHGKHETRESFRKRILIMGKTNNDRKLTIVLSPEDKNLKEYGNGIYYVITAFEKEVLL